MSNFQNFISFSLTLRKLAQCRKTLETCRSYFYCCVLFLFRTNCPIFIIRDLPLCAMVITWHRDWEYSSGTIKIFFTLIQFSSFFIKLSAEQPGLLMLLIFSIFFLYSSLQGNICCTPNKLNGQRDTFSCNPIVFCII